MRGGRRRGKRSLGPVTLVLVTPPPPGEHGDPGTGLPDRKDVPGCSVDPRTGEEARGTASTLITGLVAYLPIPFEQIKADMQIEYRGELYDVDGEPGQHTYMDGQDAAAEVRLRKSSD